MKKVLLFSLIFILAACNNQKNNTYESIEEMLENAKEQVSYVGPDALKAMIEAKEAIYLIDCREEEEFEISCIQEAMNIPRGTLEGTISEKAPKKRNKLILYCSDGNRSTLAATVLPLLKYSNVYVLKGGIDTFYTQFPELIEKNPIRGNTESKPVAKPSGGCGG